MDRVFTSVPRAPQLPLRLVDSASTPQAILEWDESRDTVDDRNLASPSIYTYIYIYLDITCIHLYIYMHIYIC